jgi:hypothetical protein
VEKFSRIKSKEVGTSEKKNPPPKPHCIAQRELRKKVYEVEKKQRETYKPPLLSDYGRSLDKSYKALLKAKRAGKNVAQLRQQSKQSIDPLVVDDDCTNAQGGPIDREALQNFMNTTGLTPQQLIGGGSIPIANFYIYQTYEYGSSLVNCKTLSSLGYANILIKQVVLKSV